jgi:hypothetical protein
MNFKIYNKQNFHPHKPILDKFLLDFSKSDDNLSKNYIIDYEDLEEITLIMQNNTLVAFSSVLRRDIWPDNCCRIFNRLIRNKDLPWNDYTFGTISKIMHDEQINFCKKNKVDFVFLSIQGKKRKWLKRWCKQANVYSPEWIQIDGMVKVCNGPPKSCIQNIAYKNISGTKNRFDFLDKIISYDDYLSLI